MKNSLLVISLFISVLLTAQTKVTVTLAGFSFTPSTTTINVGDTVEFINSSGVHWVDGRQGTYAANPVSFDNQSQSGSGWTYTQVFNTAGFYDYQCGIHLANMTGSITVQVPTGINDPIKSSNAVDFYPNPSSSHLFFPDYKSVNNIIVYSVTGEKVLENAKVTDKVNISALIPGTYFVKIITKDGKATTKKIIVQ